MTSLSCLPAALLLTCSLAAVAAQSPEHDRPSDSLLPSLVSSPVRHDTDDPAIWIHPTDPSQSLILGTDKNVDGALVVFGLDGQERPELTVRGLVRPNNVDIIQNVPWAGGTIDVAVVTERLAHRLRVYRLPDLAPLDGGGIPVFAGERAREPMGIGLYLRPSDGALFAIVSRAPDGAPLEGYLHQYRLVDDGTGVIRGVFARRFGTWSGRKEIEAVAVDSELGYVYYADELYGVRKYLADPAAEDAEDELATFGREGFARDREGIAIYRFPDGTGYLIVSDQQAQTFQVFPREGLPGQPHTHPVLATLRLAALETDGCEVTSHSLSPNFPGGLFVAMSTDRTFHFYAWADLAAAAGLRSR